MGKMENTHTEIQIGVARREKRGLEGEGYEGLIIGIRKEIAGKLVAIGDIGEGIMIEKVRMGEERWRVIGVYVNRRGIRESR